MKQLAICLLISFFLILACVGDKPLSQYEATDEEAIFNVITIDNNRISELTIFRSDIPDTLDFAQNPDPENPMHWHVVDSTIEEIRVYISNHPVESPVGQVIQASAVLTNTWQGVFHSLRYNDDADSLERNEKEFELTGTRSAICQQWGQSSHRRGWLLTSISNASFTSPGGGQPFLNNLVYQSDSNTDSVFLNTIYEKDDILRFDTEEEITIRFNLSDDSDYLSMFIPMDNFSYELASPVAAAGGEYEVVVTMPSLNRIYGQIRFLVINAGDFSDVYHATGYSYNYRMR
jgi:hypothetical protein